jgi:glycosyltransferase involved in cell wall biosynthesis
MPDRPRVVFLRLNDMTRDNRIQREATALAEAGHAVTVLALRGQGLCAVDDSGVFALRRVADATDVSWRSPVAKLAQTRERGRSLAEAACRLRPHVVHCVDSDTLAVGALVARRTGAKVVYEAAELYPDMLLANRAHVPAPVLAYWRRIERRFVPRADAVITVGDAIAEEIRRRFAVDPVVVRSVPILEPPADRGLLRRELDVSDDQVVLLYQGLINYGRALSVMIDAVALVPSVVFAIQGYGPLVEPVLAYAREAGVADRVRYLGAAPIDRLHGYASGADIGDVVLENLSLNNYLAEPNKLYQYLMAGIPVLGSDFPGMRPIVEGERTGLVCDPTDAKSVVAALQCLVSDAPLRAEMGQRARRLAETRYNWEYESRTLVDLYRRLLADGR